VLVVLPLFEHADSIKNNRLTLTNMFFIFCTAFI
jgi:hypothetical protein